MPVVNQPTDKKPLSRERSELVRKHLRFIMSSRPFARSPRAREFLALTVRHAIGGRYSNLRERMIGAELFGRSVDYDTGSDSVVRVMATDVRKRLNQFYLESTQRDWPVRFELPSGSYVPLFLFADASAEPETQPQGIPDLADSAEPADSMELAPNGSQATEPAPSVAPEVEEKRKLDVPPHAVAVVVPEVLPGKRHLRVWIAALALAGALLSGGIYRIWTTVAHPGQQIRSLVILPLKNLSGNPKQDFVADGITAELINNLGQISTLRVISLTSSMNLKNSTKMVPEIARELNVQGVIEGSVQRDGNRVRVNIELVDGRKDRPIWTRTYLRDADDVLNLQGEIAADIVREVTTPVSAREQSRLAQNHAINAEARAAYLHGLLLLEADKEVAAFPFLQQAVQADPQFAQAHSVLAECLGRMAFSGLKPNQEALTVQKSQALQAISLDPWLAEAHAELADAIMGLDWDWKTAGTEYERAVELNPNSAEIRQKYAIFLIFQGKTEAAMKQVEMGADLDPISSIALRNELFLDLFARKYDKVLSLIQTNRSVGIDPPGSSFFLGALYAEKGNYQASIDWFLKGPDTPHTLGHLGAAYARSGQRAAALKCLATLDSDVRDPGIGHYEEALVYAGLGEKKKAIQWLKRASEAHDVGILYVKIDPVLDPLRSDPEFQDLVKRIGLTL